MNTILITGASSGYGRETALYFHEQGWNVIATMRNPSAADLPESERMRVLQLDVTDPDSISAALGAAGPFDVLVNNAGIGAVGIFEAMTMERVRRIFETNTFGVMAVTHAAVPLLRAQGSGLVINVTSSVVLGHMPLVSVYKASKMAVEGFTASLALELEAVGLEAKIVQPGYCPTTRFAANVGPVDEFLLEPYSAFSDKILGEFAHQEAVTTERHIAEAVWRAAHDTTGQLRFPAGPDSVSMAQAR